MTQPAKHTPGPWYAANMGNDFQGLVVEEQTGKNIAVAYDKRDVHILAAAPAMYEALHSALNNVDRLGDVRSAYRATWIKQVTKLLAQAEGQHHE